MSSDGCNSHMKPSFPNIHNLSYDAFAVPAIQRSAVSSRVTQSDVSISQRKYNIGGDASGRWGGMLMGCFISHHRHRRLIAFPCFDTSAMCREDYKLRYKSHKYVAAWAWRRTKEITEENTRLDLVRLVRPFIFTGYMLPCLRLWELLPGVCAEQLGTCSTVSCWCLRSFHLHRRS